jgi:chromosome segregation ATPase
VDFKELDTIFDQALKRLDTKKPSALDPYSEGPHSADHFLLKKSWDYFKDRIRTIESHWEEIVKSKDQELFAVKEELRLAREELGEAEIKNQMLDQFEEEVRKTRSVDFVNFQKLSERLKQSWEEERQSLAAQLAAVEFALKTERDRTESLHAEMDKRAKQAAAAADALKEENARLSQKNLEETKHSFQTAGQKDQEITAREARIELLKAEVERRDHVLVEQSESLNSMGTKIDALLLRIKQADENTADRDTQIKNLTADLERLQFENESIKKAWQNEQAQWRELWERARELWDQRQKGGNK